MKPDRTGIYTKIQVSTDDFFTLFNGFKCIMKFDRFHNLKGFLYIVYACRQKQLSLQPHCTSQYSSHINTFDITELFSRVKHLNYQPNKSFISGSLYFI